jgi:hypothetical protein
MHTIEFNSKWVVHFNGDFSGDVEFVSPSGERHVIPFYAVADLVAEKIRRGRIAELESATKNDLLK